MHLPRLNSRHIVGTRTDSTSYSDAAWCVLAWASTPESRYVCVSEVHVKMESHDSTEYRAIERAAAAGMAVWFYGASPEVLDCMLGACRRRFPGLRVAYAHAPPFRQLSAEEDARSCGRSTAREHAFSLSDWAVPNRTGGWRHTGDQ